MVPLPRHRLRSTVQTAWKPSLLSLIARMRNVWPGRVKNLSPPTAAWLYLLSQARIVGAVSQPSEEVALPVRFYVVGHVCAVGAAARRISRICRPGRRFGER